MFTHLVLLKKSPWFIYAANEADALSYCANFKDDIVGVAISNGGFEVKQPSIQIKLSRHQQAQIGCDQPKEEVEAESLDKLVDKKLEEAADQALS